jgi:hypothetical protein
MERKFILLFFQISGKINGYIDNKYRRNNFATKKTKTKKLLEKLEKQKPTPKGFELCVNNASIVTYFDLKFHNITTGWSSNKTLKRDYK